MGADGQDLEAADDRGTTTWSYVFARSQGTELPHYVATERLKCQSTPHSLSLCRYCTASAKCGVSIPSLPARSAMVRASLSTR